MLLNYGQNWAHHSAIKRERLVAPSSEYGWSWWHNELVSAMVVTGEGVVLVHYTASLYWLRFHKCLAKW